MDNSGFYHKELADGTWAGMPLIAQMANIGSEIHRTAVWMKKEKKDRETLAFYRTLELIDLSLAAKPRRSALFELCRLREFFCDIVLSQNQSELDSLDKSFNAWGLAYNQLNR